MTVRPLLETLAIVIATDAVLTALWWRWPGATYAGACLLLVGLLALFWRSGRASARNGRRRTIKNDAA